MRLISRIVLALTALLVLPAVADAQRSRISINDCWSFSLAGGESTIVSFPHTWNNQDCVDDTPGYYRGEGRYSRSISFSSKDLSGRRITILFEGADQVATLLVNGVEAGRHIGGYTAFSFDITSLLHEGENSFEIIVDNSFNKDIPPLSADFTFFGGVYRDVYLVNTPETCISSTHYASDGVYANATEIKDGSAKIAVRTMVTAGKKAPRAVYVSHTLISPDGKIVASADRKVNIIPGKADQPVETSMKVVDPQLWSMENPVLYRLHTTVSDGSHTDEVVTPLGIRSILFDPEEGFFINGKYTKLMGTNRHQDYHLLGNALPDEMHVRDIELLKDMGGNFLRISHYPQDPIILDECDKRGIVCSEEIPIVNYVTASREFHDNCINMAKEMVYQYFNHPSIIMWAYMNEILLHGEDGLRTSGSSPEYIQYLYDTASDIDNTFRTLDPGRYTMLPCHAAHQKYADARISFIPQVIGYNLYDGWYSGTIEGFGAHVDQLHALHPQQSLLVTEYGADTDMRLHSLTPVRFDFTAEYGNLYHEGYIPAILDRKFLAGTCIWNLNEFYSEHRGQATSHVNSKGITTLDRTRKDSYYLYQAYLSDQPVMHICSSLWKKRGGQPQQEFCVYSNAKSVSAVLNGKAVGTKTLENHKATFDVALREGTNSFLVSGEVGGETVYDLYQFEYHDPSRIDAGFNALNVILGGLRFFEDDQTGCIWVPEREYTPGSWGYVGGKPYITNTRRGVTPASIDDIRGTDKNPLFQTYRSGIEAFKADVPDGVYSVYLYFCELATIAPKDAPVYNLGAGKGLVYSTRVFDVAINGNTVIPSCDVMKEFGPLRGVIRKCQVYVENGKGITVSFTPQEGEAYLNAIRIYREF